MQVIFPRRSGVKKSAPAPPSATSTTKQSGSIAGIRRSPCPVACCLDIIGDRWTLLVIRDLILGRSRFKDFTASPEGIPTNILTERLQRLQLHGLATRAPSPGSKHPAYQLTPKGEALVPVLRAMKDWGLTWEPGTRDGLS